MIALIDDQEVEVPSRIVACVNPACTYVGYDIEIPDDGTAVVCGGCRHLITPATEETEPTND